MICQTKLIKDNKLFEKTKITESKYVHSTNNGPQVKFTCEGPIDHRKLSAKVNLKFPGHVNS